MTTIEFTCAILLFAVLAVYIASILRKERAKRTFFRCLDASRKAGIEKEFIERFYLDQERSNDLYERIEILGSSVIQKIYDETESLHAEPPSRKN